MPINQFCMSKQTSFKYLVSSDRDRSWGITVDTVGACFIEAGYAIYPPPSAGHPDDYFFHTRKGRVLDSYQLIYISQGRGWYHETPEKKIEIKSGTMLVILPYTWHSYYPDKDSGWQEYWIGFRGQHIDDRYNNGFFSRNNIIRAVGFREHLIDLYKEALEIALREKAGHQQVLASIANSILAHVIYYANNAYFDNDSIAEKIDLARSIMRENMLTDITPVEVADRINMSYSWFRKTFKEYTSVSPAHYITLLRLQKAKLLLLNSTMSIKEIAFYLNYEDTAYFSAIFKKYVGCPPSEYKTTCHEGVQTL